MNNRWIAIVAILALGAAAAQGYVGWGIYGSYWGTADAGDAFGGGIKISPEIIDGVQFDLRASGFSGLGEGDADLDVYPLEAGLALTWPVAGKATLLAGGGAGYYLMDGNTETGEADDGIGFYVVTGLELPVRHSEVSYGQTEAAFFVEALYRGADAGGDTDLDGFGVNAGIMVKW
jgi:hypothetical protein